MANKFVTLGSCFAQHIGDRLKRNGIAWIESEANSAEPASQFSFRTGNIYTTAVLRQWFAWAFEGVSPPDEIFESDGRFFDPFRPSVSKAGYDSAQALVEARDRTLDHMRRTFEETDLVLILTLGLTECFMHTEGWFYPVCPGTIRGHPLADLRQ